MANTKSSQFVIKKSYHNVYFLVISVIILILLGVLISKTVTFFIVNTDEILSNSEGTLDKKKEFNMKAFEDLKAKRPINQ